MIIVSPYPLSFHMYSIVKEYDNFFFLFSFIELVPTLILLHEDTLLILLFLLCLDTRSTFQGVVLDILVAVGIIRSTHIWLDVEHVEEAFQNVLICLEMIVFSVFQQYAFNVGPYSGEVERKLKMKKND